MEGEGVMKKTLILIGLKVGEACGVTALVFWFWFVGKYFIPNVGDGGDPWILCILRGFGSHCIAIGLIGLNWMICKILLDVLKVVINKNREWAERLAGGK